MSEWHADNGIEQLNKSCKRLEHGYERETNTDTVLKLHFWVCHNFYFAAAPAAVSTPSAVQTISLRPFDKFL
jgi:hypothetical protein